MLRMLEPLIAPPESNDDLDDHNDLIIMEFAKEKYFHGKSSVDELSEFLKNDGDFVVRSNEEDNKKEQKEKPLITSVKWGSDFHHFPIYFHKSSDGNQIIAFEKDDPRIHFRNVSDLIREYVKKHTPLDKGGTHLLRPVERQVHELKRADIKLEVLIGEGAFGTVHSGKYVVKGNPVPVAIKITKFSQDIKKCFEDMLSEAKTMSALQHQNVIRFYGMTMGESDLWIVMELVTGGSLDKFIAANSDLGPVDRWNLAFDCAKGLNYLHSNRILHRDVAARNCLVDTKGGKNIVKLSDFGMSAKGEMYRIEPTERTPIKWLSPEILRTGVFNKPCDIWAFGCCVYEIFTGKTPFYETDNKTVREKLVSDPNFRPSLKEFNVIIIAVELMKCTWREDPIKRSTMKHYVNVMPQLLQAYLKVQKGKGGELDLCIKKLGSKDKDIGNNAKDSKENLCVKKLGSKDKDVGHEGKAAKETLHLKRIGSREAMQEGKATRESVHVKRNGSRELLQEGKPSKDNMHAKKTGSKEVLQEAKASKDHLHVKKTGSDEKDIGHERKPCTEYKEVVKDAERERREAEPSPKRNSSKKRSEKKKRDSKKDSKKGSGKKSSSKKRRSKEPTPKAAPSE